MEDKGYIPLADPLAEAVRRGRATIQGERTNAANRTPRELEFMRAMDRFKRQYHRPYPTWSEVLAVIDALGYVKAQPAAAE